jgi:tRNA (guanine26-N2/guanine27-N2)-dimethyltransferase
MDNLMQEGAVTFNVGSAFFNPKMKLNRDICVAMVRSLKIISYLDALSASGVRGLRVAKEGEVEKVTLNDVSPSAYERVKENISRNQLTNCDAYRQNANALMHERHFETVDLDPFGSPAPFLSAASRSATSYLFITATDTAPLCGAHQKSGIRKYMALPVRTEYHREMGARILLGAIARELARLDKAMVPLLTHVTDHYVRTYSGIEKGAKPADRSLEEIGYVKHCHRCGAWSAHKGLECKHAGECPSCGGNTTVAGPLWLGSLHDRAVLKAAIEELDKLMERNDRAARLLRLCKEEIDVPMYYDHHNICKRLKLTPSRIEEVIDLLHENGWQASRTHFSGVGIKTDATMEDLQRLLLNP